MSIVDILRQQHLPFRGPRHVTYSLTSNDKDFPEQGARHMRTASMQVTSGVPCLSHPWLLGALPHRLQRRISRQALGMRQVACSARSTAPCWQRPAAPAGCLPPRCSAPAQPSAARPPPAAPVAHFACVRFASCSDCRLVRLGPGSPSCCSDAGGSTQQRWQWLAEGSASALKFLLG